MTPETMKKVIDAAVAKRFPEFARAFEMADVYGFYDPAGERIVLDVRAGEYAKPKPGQRVHDAWEISFDRVAFLSSPPSMLAEEQVRVATDAMMTAALEQAKEIRSGRKLSEWERTFVEGVRS